MWLDGFLGALSVHNVLWLILGTIFGLVIGVLPALGSTLGVAVMLPFTFALDPVASLIFLTAIHAACNYGDSLASVLLNIPGGPGTVATCWDGYPMAQQGRAGRALGIATLGSFVGGVIAWLTLVALVKPIETIAFEIGAPEYFALGVMALSLISVASKGQTIKGLIMAGLGLLLSTVGQDPISGSTYRFTFGLLWLEAGIPIVVSTLGIFAIPQMIEFLEEGGTVSKVIGVKDSIFSGFVDVLRRPLTILRSGIIGWFIGILPALGVSLAGITAYLVEKGASPEGKDFGKGTPGGVVAAEVSKGACTVAALIPTFLLGVPGSVAAAILMGALIIHGIDPGPRFLLSGNLPYIVFAGLLLGQLLYAIIGPMFCKLCVPIVYIPTSILTPVVGVLIFFGAFVERNYAFDLLLVVALGILAYGLSRLGYETVCLILGLILGRMLEENLGRALGIEYGSWAVFLHRPIALVLLVATAVGLAWPYLWPRLKRWYYLIFLKRGNGRAATEQQTASVKAMSITLANVLSLIAIAVVAGVFLWQARSYQEEVAFFPKLISEAILVLVGIELLSAWLTKYHKTGGDLPGPSERELRRGVPGYVSIILFLGYVALAYLVGFVIASIVFTAVTAIMAGYRKWLVIAGTSIAMGVLIAVFARALEISLPMGVILEAILH